MTAQRTNKTGNNPLVGCLVGCFAVVTVVFVLAAGGLFYTFRFGSFASAPRTETLPLVGSGNVVTVHVDLEAPTALSLSTLEGTSNPGAGALLRLFRPYMGTLAFSASPDGREVYASAAVSAPRGVSVYKNMVEGFRPELETGGRKLTQLLEDPEHAGVLTGRLMLPTPAEAPRLRAEAWGGGALGQVVASEGRHFISVEVDNRRGDAALVFAALAQAAGEDADATGLSLLSQVRLIKGSRLVSALRMTADFTPEGDVQVLAVAEAPNEVSAMLLMSNVSSLPEALSREWAGTGVEVSGSVTRTGTRIEGQVTFANAVEQMRAFMDEYNRRGGIAGFGEGEVPSFGTVEIGQP